MSFVRAGERFAPSRLIAGIPAKTLRAVSDDEINWKISGTMDYQKLVHRSKYSLKQVEPLQTLDPNRDRIPVMESQSLHTSRR